MEDFAPVAQIYAHTLKERIKKLFGWINGPYRAAAAVVLAVLLVLFGRDVFESLRVRNDIRKLRARKEFYERSIERDSTLLQNLRNPDFLERYARERYLMKRDGEEVYVIKK